MLSKEQKEQITQAINVLNAINVVGGQNCLNLGGSIKILVDLVEKDARDNNPMGNPPVEQVEEI